jgi:hypothetical protein
MGMATSVNLCSHCGQHGAGVQLMNDQGQVLDGRYCWDCAQKRSTPLPKDGPLLGALAFVDRAWLLTRQGATWLAARLEADRKRREEAR